MCAQTTVNKITNKIAQAAREALGDKLDKVILYGSYARGDYADGSDVDIMVLAHIVDKEELRTAENALWDIGWEIGFEYDVMVTVFLKDCESFYKFLPAEPFYQNVMRDGVTLSA